MQIYQCIQLGTSNSYLIASRSGLVLVDAGNKNYIKKFEHSLHEFHISPDQVKLIIITHVHFDHVGSLNDIKELCGCEVAVHRSEASLLRTGTSTLPPGTNPLARGISWLGNNLLPNSATEFDEVEPEILVDEEIDLLEFGVNGRIVHTPGHTSGSISLLLDSGEAFVGDLAVNYLPFDISIFPPFAEDTTQLIASWRKIQRMGARIILPAHGRPFSADKFKKYF